MKREEKILVCDFETTVYTGQIYTEVWAAAAVELFTENVSVFNNIDDFYNYLVSLNQNLKIYFHNLKFDGEFILHYLLNDRRYKQAYIEETTDNETTYTWLKPKEMPNHSFRYSISDRGQWYSIIIREGKRTIEIWDSLKIIPFSVLGIGKQFETKHKKSSIEYEGERHAYMEITPEERAYIANDVLVVKEALELMYKQGHNKMTIGSCCMTEYKRINANYKELFPDLLQVKIDKEIYGSSNADEYIRKSYRGGWCYVDDRYKRKVLSNGVTVDVNSLYPSVMHSMSGSIYPYANPTFWVGDIPKRAYRPNTYFFVRFQCNFELKPNYLPFVQIKGDVNYRGNENLKTSKIKNYRDSIEYTTALTAEGEYIDNKVTLTMTCVDYKLFLEHYNVTDLTILDGCYFNARAGLFDEYIDVYRQKKENAPNKGHRTIAKLFSNNLYGKMASTDDSSFKIAFIKENGAMAFKRQEEHMKQAGYIAIGSAITSYARNFTIRAAQQNYDYFCYADTDSLHLNTGINNIKGVHIHNTHYCCWKVESEWDTAFFTRQKGYMEHVIRSDGKDIDPYWDIKCAGMNSRSKEFIASALTGKPMSKPPADDEKWFFETPFHIDDFVPGLAVPGDLQAKRIRGGIVLLRETYHMKGD